MNQYFNWKGFKSLFSSSTYRNIVPHVKVKNVSEINFVHLKNQGFKGVIFDKDNTLTHPYKYNLDINCKRALENCLEVFGPDKVAIFSNTAGNYNDKLNNYVEAKEVENRLGLKVIRHKEQKPSGQMDVQDHFSEIEYTKDIIVVGDRYFTDVLFGNRMGALTVKTDIITPIGENFAVKMARVMEQILVQCLEYAGIRNQHPMLPDMDKVVIKKNKT